jgi:UDP-2,4-diacetamido-2,4,6-trideoxy-beta-L-altropyranose hydrolase
MTIIPRIFFRADGNSSIGLGHIIRSLSLADMLKEHFKCTFVCIGPSEYVKKQVYEAGMALTLIETEEEFIGMVGKNNLVVLDGYQYTTEYMQAICNTGAKLIYIDDLHDKYYPAHLIINHNPVIKQEHYQVPAHTKLLLGLNYALLRKPFRDAAQQERIPSPFRQLLICLGGADPLNLTPKVLQAAIRCASFENIAIVGAPENSTSVFASGIQNCTFHLNLSATEMAELMLQSDMMIAPSSSLSLEALATKIPLVSGYYASNQEEFYTFLMGAGAAYGIGDFRKISEPELAAHFNSAMQFFRSGKQPALIDGKQASRFITAFNTLLN